MKTLALAVLLGGIAVLRAEEPKNEAGPIGPVRLELIDKTAVSGILLRINDITLLLRTNDGDHLIERKNVRKIDPLNEPLSARIAAPAKEAAPAAKAVAAAAPPAEAPKPAKVIDDMPEDAPAKAAKAAPSPLLVRLNLLNKEPVKPDAKNEAEELRVSVRAKSSRSKGREAPARLQSAINAIALRSYQSASESMRNLIAQSSDDELAIADSCCMERYGRNLADTLVMCYMQYTCSDCKSQGMKTCGHCGGAGYVTKWVASNSGGPTPGTRKGTNQMIGLLMGNSTDGNQHRSVDICSFCHSHGYDACQTCMGTRMAYAAPSAYEASAYAAQLVKLAESSLKESEGGYGGTYREAPPVFAPRDHAKMRPMTEQAWLRDSINRIKSDIMRITRAQGYYYLATKADPELVLRSNTFITQEITKIAVRRQNLQSEMLEREQIYAQNRTEHRLDEMAWSDNYYEHPPESKRAERAKIQEVLGDE
jgi:hypothetical protein